MEVDLCSQAVSELYVLASDVIFETNMKTQGMYLNADGISIYFYNLSLPEKKQQPQPKAEKPKARTKTNSMTGIFPGFLAKPRNDFSMAQTMIEIGEYVAEPALWVKSWRYQGQLQAVVESRMLLVIPEELFSVLRHYTEAMSSAIVYARCFLKELNSVSMSTQVTDLPLVPSSPDGSKSFHFLNWVGMWCFHDQSFASTLFKARFRVTVRVEVNYFLILWLVYRSFQTCPNVQPQHAKRPVDLAALTNLMPLICLILFALRECFGLWNFAGCFYPSPPFLQIPSCVVRMVTPTVLAEAGLAVIGVRVDQSGTAETFQSLAAPGSKLLRLSDTGGGRVGKPRRQNVEPELCGTASLFWFQKSHTSEFQDLQCDKILDGVRCLNNFPT